MIGRFHRAIGVHTPGLCVQDRECFCQVWMGERLRIRQFFESYGVMIQEWDRVRTDWLTLRAVAPEPEAVVAK